MLKNLYARQLTEFINSHNLSLNKIAVTAGISEGTLRGFRDVQNRHLTLENILAITNALSYLTNEDLYTTDLFNDLLMEKHIYPIYTIEKVTPERASIYVKSAQSKKASPRQDLPIIGTAITEDGYMILYDESAGLTKRPPALVGKEHAFAITAYFSEMEPRIYFDEIIYVDTDTTPNENDDALITIYCDNDEYDANSLSLIRRIKTICESHIVVEQHNPKKRDCY